MKISKDQIKKIIFEQIDNNRDLANAIESLTSTIDDLDISIDYLASAITGEQALSIGLRQKALGRVASPHSRGLKGSIDEGHNGEGSMARSQLGRTTELASMLQSMIQDDSNLEEWVESKITKAHDYLSSVLNYMRGEQLSERELSKPEKKEKEKIVKGMKKSKKDFEDRYGEDAESVMYATATKMAKEKK